MYMSDNDCNPSQSGLVQLETSLFFQIDNESPYIKLNTVAFQYASIAQTLVHTFGVGGGGRVLKIQDRTRLYETICQAAVYQL